MSDHDLRLAHRPARLHPGYPRCAACDAETGHTGDGWLCQSPGALWATDALDAIADEAALYAEWFGDDLTGPVCLNALTFRVPHPITVKERDDRVRAATAHHQ